MDAIDVIENEPSRLGAEQEIALAKAVEAGLYARCCLARGLWDAGASAAELELVAEQGERALLVFHRANMAMVRHIARKWDKPGVAEFDELVAEGGEVDGAGKGEESGKDGQAGKGQESASPEASEAPTGAADSGAPDSADGSQAADK